MTNVLRIVLIVVSLLTLIFIVRKIRQSKILLEDSIYWLLFSFLLFISSLFPQIFEFLARVTGVYSTVNFVFLFIIFALLIKCFTMSVQISKLDTKIKEIAQQLAIEKYDRKYQNDEFEEM